MRPGKPLSQNFYWLAAHDADFRKLNDLPAVTPAGHAQPNPLTRGTDRSTSPSR